MSPPQYKIYKRYITNWLDSSKYIRNGTITFRAQHVENRSSDATGKTRSCVLIYQCGWATAEPCLCPTAGASHHSGQINVLTRRNAILCFISWNPKYDNKSHCGVWLVSFIYKYTGGLELFMYTNHGLLKCPLILKSTSSLFSNHDFVVSWASLLSHDQGWEWGR